MIIDWQNSPDEAARYSVFDMENGECLDRTLKIFYADDEAGILRCYSQDERGSLYLADPVTKLRIDRESFVHKTTDGKELYPLEGGVLMEREPEIAWREIKWPIRIRPREASEVC
jgi:hypothetical protein